MTTVRLSCPLVGLLVLAGPLLSGCGGGDAGPSPASSAGRGTATLKIAWPARGTRLIPSAANSIVVALDLGSTHIEKTLARPPVGQNETSVTLTGLKYGEYTVDVKAYPTAVGTGVPQATGAGTMTVAESAPGTLDVTLDSTVTAFTISPEAPTIRANGKPLTLTATATDAQGRMVLLESGGGTEPLVWMSANADRVSVQWDGPRGILRGTPSSVGSTTTVTILMLQTAHGDTAITTKMIPVKILPGAIIVAASGQGTRPGQPAPTLQDGVVSVSPPQTTSWRAAFGLPAIPSGATILSASLAANIDSTRIPRTDHTFVAYDSGTGTGNGVTLGNVSGSIGGKSVDASDAVKSRIAAGAGSIGLGVSPSSTANLGTASWSSPVLTILYDLNP